MQKTKCKINAKSFCFCKSEHLGIHPGQPLLQFFFSVDGGGKI